MLLLLRRLGPPLGQAFDRIKQFDQARAYMDHAVDQALTILKHRSVSALFTTPKLLEALSERRDLVRAGIKGVFCGGTTMDKQYARFWSKKSAKVEKSVSYRLTGIL